MRVLIIGGGKVGTYLAERLLREKHSVLLIEMREEEKERILLDIPEENLRIGSGTDPDVLEAAGIRKANVVAAVTGSDETNLVVTTLARYEFLTPRIIARINHPKNAWLFTKEMGVDVAINQADLMADLIAEEMSMGDMMTMHVLRHGKMRLVEEKIAPNALADGKRLSELNLPDQCNIVSVIRDGNLLILKTDPILQTADEVFAIVHEDQKKALARFFNLP
ncbi:MAG: TrkA family potassium uptake protein [Anaerolineaceae bacterium]|jgi:trk system potassium uptake protein TrkA|nr:TrkA family potassium uptake protein [Anaerolineaceae bacterium]MDI9530362.1 TrkA family potassium uptake protein [Chloroflexota bacterium]NLE92901.1 TrkA family potassium uptake protein [Chloroflexota bacterium]